MSDDITLALLRHLVRTGDFDADEISAIADDLNAQGLTEAAHRTRLTLIEAAAPLESDWSAARRRADIRERTAHLSSADGGNKAI